MFVGSPRWKALTPAAQVEQLFWLYVGISAGAAGRWDDRRLTGVGRRSLRFRSMSGGQITPPLWPSFWPRVRLLRSCLVQSCVSVCAEAEHIAVSSAAIAIRMCFPVLLIQI